MIGIDVSGLHLQAIMPVLILAGFGLLILGLDMFQRRGSRTYLAYLAVAGFLSAGVSAYILWQNQIPRPLFSDMAYLDGFTQAFTCIFAASGALTCLLARDYLRSHGADRGEFYVLLLFAALGMVVAVGGANLIMVFLGLETMSISLYVLAGFFRSESRSAEASLKYLVLGALATGLLLYGIALVYGVTGTLNLADIGDIFSGRPIALPRDLRLILPDEVVQAEAMQRTVVVDAGGYIKLVPVAYLGMVLILVALMFKVAAVPFHMWAPDVYTGAPTPAVGFFATAVKAAGFAAFLRVFLLAFFGDPVRNSVTGWVAILLVLCLLSMIVGNLGAIVQSNVKRMLAYSSIAHAGYLLIAVTSSGYANLQAYNSAVVFYLVAYLFGTVGAFGVLAWFGRKGEEVETFEDLNGLGLKHPWVGAAMVVFMLSLAGIPPTAGFFAKFLVFKTAVDGSALGPRGGIFIAVAAVGITVSVAGVYYYLRVVVHMYMRKATRVIRPLGGRAAAVALAVCAALTLALGVLPSRLSTISVLAAERMADSPEGPDAVPFPTMPRVRRAEAGAAE